jgi:hypothetical protein
VTLPNFMIIGAAKSGTSALYRYSRQHPEIYMSQVKETHFFSYKDAPPNTIGPGDSVNQAITDMATYLTLFEDAGEARAIGEASPTYLYSARAPRLIKEYIPEARLIAILRQPADRAFSAFMHVTRDGREPIADFAEALKLEEERIALNWGPIWHYTKIGFYSEQIRRYYELFEREQIKVYLYDDFSARPIDVLQDIFRFLDVNDTFVPDVRIRANVSGVQRSQTLYWLIERLFARPNPIRTVARKLLSEETRWRFTSNVRNQNIVHQSISPEIRHQLTELFREDILRLQDLLARDLSHWLQEDQRRGHS